MSNEEWRDLEALRSPLSRWNWNVKEGSIMTVEKQSPCKVNLLLNILGKRPDGFHEVETVMHPIDLCDGLKLAIGGSGVQLTCSEPSLPTDSSNLVYRAAAEF